MTNNKQRDIWIDTLRGIAALGVMIAHLAVTFPNIGVKGSGTGKLFVSLFLCITGFTEKHSIRIISALIVVFGCMYFLPLFFLTFGTFCTTTISFKDFYIDC